MANLKKDNGAKQAPKAAAARKQGGTAGTTAGRKKSGAGDKVKKK